MKMQEKQRLNRITKQLNKLNNLIEFTKNQSMAAFQVLQNCHNSSSQSSSNLEDQIDSSHNISQMFDEADSRDTIQITSNNLFDQFMENKSLQMSRPAIQNKQAQQNTKSHFDMYHSNLSSQGFKESTIQISEIKPIDTTVKKAKLLKSNLNKNKKNLFQKQRILSNNDKSEKIGRIKSQNKLMANASNFKRGINIIKQQMSLKKQKTMKVNPCSQITQHITIPHKNYLSSKIQTLNSKRNFKYNSMTKNQKLQKTQKLDKNSKSKFHINLQKQVTMKITDLKIKKNLCQIQTSYLSASVKITKDELNKIDDSSNQYSDQTLLKYFILKSIIKFISQYNDQTWTNSEDIAIDNDTVTNTLKKPEKFIKIINKLPDILRRKNIVSQFICKQFIQEKSFIEQKANNLGNKAFQKEPLYHYLCQLHLYIEFLLNNNMIHETKRHKIFNPTTQEFFSDRSAKQMKLTVNGGKQSKFMDAKKKQFSERKKSGVTTLKRVNTSKALKKGTTSTKSKKPGFGFQK